MTQKDTRARAGTVRLAGAASILIACALGFWLAPFGSPYTSAGILGGIAAISFAARGLFSKT
ncbi:MAG: hypothetical protein H6891_04320 [Brucellaceae bacterium]|nr:hypothetical protein [Brucellaceae bacterium]